MAGGWEVVADELDGHGKQLLDLSDRLQTAIDAAKQVSMPTDAYGILCQPFRLMLDPVEQWGLDALQGAVDAVSATSEQVKTTAQGYHRLDQGGANVVRSV
ncbi:type VII secretion target [Umezawaea beigongshangensis]|uniref:type VII secretion target n=1 Tax=Umezawaea beigongshangensis TaxID=2780383 RepID=UPI0027DAF5BF|nr:type VII secretion target [Umezawaea beigongshangensis]